MLDDRWSTILYAEDDGLIRGAGILVNVTHSGDRATIEAPGVAAYPHGWPFSGSRNWGTQVDPMDIVRDLWAHVQSSERSDLGVTVVGSTSSNVRVGTNAEPYRLRWWENVDVGSEIDDLAGTTPFDYTEEYVWSSAAKSGVTHRVRVGWPRLGRKRTDLRFVEGENITEVLSISQPGDEYANEVLGIGHGEPGPRLAWSRKARDDPHRLRRIAVVTDKTARQQRIERVAANELARFGATASISELQVIEHPNAPIAAINPGDDIPVTVDSPSYGSARIWLRVTAVTEHVGGYTATLSTSRSSAFSYSPTLEV
jgi:hypothetical protein